MDALENLRAQYDAARNNAQLQLDATDYHLTESGCIYTDLINKRIEAVTESIREMTNVAVAIKEVEEHMVDEHEAEVRVGLQHDAEADLAAQVDRLAYVIAGLYGCPDRSYAEWCPGAGCAFTEALDGPDFDEALVHCWKQVAK